MASTISSSERRWKVVRRWAVILVAPLLVLVSVIEYRLWMWLAQKNKSTWFTDPIRHKYAFVICLLLTVFALYVLTYIQKRRVKSRITKSGILEELQKRIAQRRSVQPGNNDSLMGDPPEGIGLVTVTGETTTIHILESGPFAGRAAFFSVFAIFFMLFVAVGAIKSAIVSPNEVEFYVRSTILFAGISVLFWILAIWFGRFRLTFDLGPDKLHIIRTIPPLGIFRVRDIRWRDLSLVEIEWPQTQPSRGITYPSLRLEVDGYTNLYYLRFYPVEVLHWMVTVLDSARLRNGGE